MYDPMIIIGIEKQYSTSLQEISFAADNPKKTYIRAYDTSIAKFSVLRLFIERKAQKSEYTSAAI